VVSHRGPSKAQGIPQSDAARRKANLLAAIGRAGAEARRSYTDLLHTAEDHQHLESIAELTGRWVAELPERVFDDGVWEEYLRRWEYTGDTVVIGRWDSRAESLVRSAGDTIASGTMALLFDSAIFEELPAASRGEVTSLRESLRELLAWPEVYDTVVGKLVCKQLHATRPGTESPWDLLEAARSALGVRSANRVAPVNVLAPLLGAIDGVLEELTRRLPLKDGARGWSGRVASVLEQSAVGGMPPELIADLARDADARAAELSSAGASAGPASDVERRFLDGLLFLSAFLSAVDTLKLRPA
jgi:hypothetical protein